MAKTETEIWAKTDGNLQKKGLRVLPGFVLTRITRNSYLVVANKQFSIFNFQNQNCTGTILLYGFYINVPT